MRRFRDGLTLWLLAAAVACGLATAAAAQEAGPDLWLGGAGPGPTWDPEQATDAMAKRSERHKAVLQGGVPLEYRNLKSPYPQALGIVREGAPLYAAHCAACHGADGLGDGKVGLDLTPPPAMLAFMIDHPDAVDEYLIWSVSEGGAPFGSEMPAFKGTLSDRDIWKIVTYMRAGFPHEGG